MVTRGTIWSGVSFSSLPTAASPHRSLVDVRARRSADSHPISLPRTGTNQEERVPHTPSKVEVNQYMSTIFAVYLSVQSSQKFLKNAFWIVVQSSLKPMIVNLVLKKEWDVIMQFTQ